jgi:hypothetical protein
MEIFQTFSTPLIGDSQNMSEIHFHPTTGFELVLQNGTEIVLGFYDPGKSLERLRKILRKGILNLSIPQRIELNDSKIAMTTPLAKTFSE